MREWEAEKGLSLDFQSARLAEDALDDLNLEREFGFDFFSQRRLPIDGNEDRQMVGDGAEGSVRRW